MLRFSGGRGSILDDGVEFDDGDTICIEVDAVVGDSGLYFFGSSGLVFDQ